MAKYKALMGSTVKGLRLALYLSIRSQSEKFQKIAPRLLRILMLTFDKTRAQVSKFNYLLISYIQQTEARLMHSVA